MRSQTQNFFWNDAITFIYEPYIVLTVAALIHFETQFSDSADITGAEKFANLFDIVLLAVVLLFPWVLLCIYKHFMKKNAPEYKKIRELNDPDYCKTLS